MTPNNVRTVRESRGITQAELAKRLGVAPSWVWKLEHGKINLRNVTFSRVVRLSMALNCELADLDAND